MMLVGHSAIGASIGLLVPNPYLAFALGVVSHHIADYVPHFDIGSFIPPEKRTMDADTLHTYSARDYWIVALDIVLTLAMLWFFTLHLPHDKYLSVGAGILGANLPDLLHNVPYVNAYILRIGWIHWWRVNIHHKYQTTVTLKNWYWGVLTQLIPIGFAFWLFSR